MIKMKYLIKKTYQEATQPEYLYLGSVFFYLFKTLFKILKFFDHFVSKRRTKDFKFLLNSNNYKGTSTYYVTRFSGFSDPPSPFATKKPYKSLSSYNGFVTNR